MENMEKRIKVNEIPFSARQLYIKLYCDRKGVKNSEIIKEASKSWENLPISKRRRFHKTSAESNFLKESHSLHNINAYLKRNKNSINTADTNDQQVETSTPIVSLSDSNIVENAPLPALQDVSMECGANPSLDEINETKEEVQDAFESHAYEENHISSEASLLKAHETQIDTNSIEESIAPVEPIESLPPSLCSEASLLEAQGTRSYTNSIVDSTAPVEPIEPPPPTLRNGKHLHEIIWKPGEKTFDELSTRERNHYNSAYRALKREWLKSYIKYLESLTQQQLFDHYKKTLY